MSPHSPLVAGNPFRRNREMSENSNAVKCTCPSCAHEFNVALYAKLAAKQSMSMTIHPVEGGKLSMLHLGGMLRSFDRLLAACSAELGVKTICMVENISMADDGSVTVTALMLSSKMSDAPSSTEGCA